LAVRSVKPGLTHALAPDALPVPVSIISAVPLAHLRLVGGIEATGLGRCQREEEKGRWLLSLTENWFPLFQTPRQVLILD